jgi:hypothetical protein
VLLSRTDRQLAAHLAKRLGHLGIDAARSARHQHNLSAEIKQLVRRIVAPFLDRPPHRWTIRRPPGAKGPRPCLASPRRCAGEIAEALAHVQLELTSLTKAVGGQPAAF